MEIDNTAWGTGECVSINKCVELFITVWSVWPLMWWHY